MEDKLNPTTSFEHADYGDVDPVVNKTPNSTKKSISVVDSNLNIQRNFIRLLCNDQSDRMLISYIIPSVIIRVMTKLDERAAGVRFVYHGKFVYLLNFLRFVYFRETKSNHSQVIYEREHLH